VSPTKLKKIFWGGVLIIILVASAACSSAPSLATTSVSEQSPTTGIPPASSVTTVSNSPTLSPQPASSPSHITPPSPSSTIPAPPTGQHTIEFGSRLLTDNTWGAPPDETFTSDVYLNDNGSFGWYWDRTDPKIITGNIGVQPIFPNVRIGGSPWEQSNSKYFPIQLSQVKSLTFLVAYNYPEFPTGQYNLAYDMFLSDTDLPSSTPVRKAEVMIWMHGTFTQPPSTYKGDFTDGFNTYALYSWVMPGDFLYYSFIMKGEPRFQARHTVEAKKLLDNLSLDPGWYIHGIELGSEIVNGTGKIEINKLVIIVNGNET
jgi:hypothetical protein